MEVAFVDVAGVGSGSFSFVCVFWKISDSFWRASIWRVGIFLCFLAKAFMAFVKSCANR